MLKFAIEQIGLPVGRIQTLTVFSMSFSEFLIAKGQDLLLEAICEQVALAETDKTTQSDFSQNILSLAAFLKSLRIRHSTNSP